MCPVPTKLRRTSPHIIPWIKQFIRTLCERGHHVDRSTPCVKDRIHLGHGEKVPLPNSAWLAGQIELLSHSTRTRNAEDALRTSSVPRAGEDFFGNGFSVARAFIHLLAGA